MGKCSSRTSESGYFGAITLPFEDRTIIITELAFVFKDTE